MNLTSNRGVAVTTSDSVDLPGGPCEAIFVGVAGDVSLYAPGPTASATAVVYKNCASGAVLPVKAQRVLATNTTATNLVALY